MRRGVLENKKGSVDESIKELGYLFIVSILLIISFMVITSLYGSFTGSKEQIAVDNLKALGNEIDFLLSSEKSFDSSIVQIEIPNNYIMVGFDKDWHGDLEDDSFAGYAQYVIKGDKVEANYCSDGEGIQKPRQCNDVSCLCIYEETSFGDDFMEEERSRDDVIACYQFNHDMDISSLKDNQEGRNYLYSKENNGIVDGSKKYPPAQPVVDGQDYEFFVAYGSCDGAWGIRRTYIEKYVDPTGKAYILISPVTEQTEDMINKRKEELEARYDRFRSEDSEA